MTDFLEYDDALTLKKLGFNEICFKHSVHKKVCGSKVDGVCPHHNIFCVYPDCEIDKAINSIPLPTYSQAFKFFRKKYNLLHELVSVQENSWLITIQDTSKTTSHGVYNGNRWDCDDLDENIPHTYEEAEHVCLKKILEIVKKESNGE